MQTGWKRPQINRIIEMKFKLGMSAGEIARKLSEDAQIKITRNSIAGVIHRELQRLDTPIAPPSAPKRYSPPILEARQ